MERWFRCNCPTSHKPLSETGWKDMRIPTCPLHQPWRLQTGTTKHPHSTLELDWRVATQVVHCLCLWRTCLNPDTPVQIGPYNHCHLGLQEDYPQHLTFFAPSSFSKVIERYSISFATVLIVTHAMTRSYIRRERVQSDSLWPPALRRGGTTSPPWNRGTVRHQLCLK